MSRSRPHRLLQCLRFALLALLGSCGSPHETVADEGGQTGSAACGSSPRCICDAVIQAQVVRGVITLDGNAQASVEVLEVFGPGSSVALGQTLTGPYQAGFPCGLGSVPSIVNGSEVLVAQPAQVPGELPPNMYVVTWAETLALTPEFTLPSKDAQILSDPVACGERFPDQEPVCQGTF